MSNNAKIYYGLSNVHYAKLTESRDPETGKIVTTYGSPKVWPGAVNLQLDAAGEAVVFSADNTAYATISGNYKGFTGSLECAMIPEDVRTDLLGNHVDNNGVIVDSDHDQISYFAMLFEFETDMNPNKYVFYKCSITKNPSVASETVDVSSDISPKTETVELKCVPRADAVTIDGIESHLVKAYTGKNIDATAYDEFYNSVYEPDFSGES